ncbi:hypothetical protein M9H77_23825 [Catharanthus roseus]|uniref:Uncharacterized protein n=1 Tax=Catharanthus roseus TaxID=4058 RepID=A0ACC0AWX2_CATRO|nr:hypothetical protein M9H77_23825 [Catharanthus roseus]
MVRPGARRGDDDLGHVTKWTGHVEGCVVIASSRGVRGHRSASYIPSTPAPFGPGPVLLPYHTVHTCPYPMNLMDLFIHHLHHMIYMQMLLLCLFVCPTRIGDIVEVVEYPDSRLFTELRASSYVLYLLGSSLFTDKSGNIVPAKLWLIVKDVRSSGMNILVLSYVFPSGETENEVMHAIYPKSCPTFWVGLMYFSTSYSPSGALQASKQQAVQCQECVYRGFVAGSTFISSDGDMGQCPCCTIISLHRRLHASISLPHSTEDTES